MALILQLVNVTVTLFIIFSKSSCIEFHRATTGVAFSPYVNRIENGEIPGWKNYDNEDVKVMLEVVSRKFTRVYTTGIGTHNVPHEEFDMYQRSNGQVMSAEAAALINRERQAKNLTMLLGIWLHDISERTDVEVQVALESAKSANKIFNETIEGFVFTQNDIHDNLIRSKQILGKIRGLRSSTELKIGTIQRCTEILGDDKAKGELSKIRREIVKASDFIICSSVPPMTEIPTGGLKFVANDFLSFRTEFKKLNPKIEVMGETSWSYQGKESWQTIENLKDHWMEVDKWGAEQNFTVWMFEAIDNPWRTWGAHRGWWRLRRNIFANQTQGYVENVVEPRHQASDATWVYVGLAIGAIAVAVILGAIVALLYNRVQKLESVLSNEDIKEFMYGLSDEAAAQYEGGVMVQSALKFPYDKSYEIAKDKLNIRKDALLGSGQFGCVYRAMIENKDGNVEVALKMAKPNCPKTALVGLLSEIKILTYLGQHLNIASLHGAYTAELLKGIVYVATELCPYGSLEDYLRKNPFRGDDADETYVNTPSIAENVNYDKLHTKPRPSDIKILDMVRWSHEIACGMEYLGEKQVIHADLATRNVLLDANKSAKVTDFGLSRRLYDYTNYVKTQQEPLPWRWMSVESLKFLEFSEKTDVWSYGVTLWEIFALGELPYPGLSWNLEFVDELVNGLRMKSPPHATPEIYEIMTSCWAMDPEGRPLFSDLKLSTAHVLKSYKTGDSDQEKIGEAKTEK